MMPTLVMDPQPAEIEALVERRRQLGLDRWDEVWEGVLHMNPPPGYAHEHILSQLHRILGPYALEAGLDVVGGVGLGVAEDNRVPDLVLQRPQDARPQWQETLALAAEVRSPNDETLAKLPFYASHGVDELLIIDPQERSVEWLALGDKHKYEPVQRSGLIDLGPAELAQRIDWSPGTAADRPADRA